MWKEKIFEEQLSIKYDEIYRTYFNDDYAVINRSNRENFNDNQNLVLDRYLGIDTIIKLSDGTRLTAQEKILSFENQKYNQLTLEYMNNQVDNPHGDWFHLVSQLYVFGYANQDNTEIEKYWICDTLHLRLFLSREIGISELKRKYLRQNKGTALASFFAIPFEIIEQSSSVILYKK